MTQLGSHLFETVSNGSSEYMRKLCITVVPAGNMEGQMYNEASRWDAASIVADRSEGRLNI